MLLVLGICSNTILTDPSFQSPPPPLLYGDRAVPSFQRAKKANAESADWHCVNRWLASAKAFELALVEGFVMAPVGGLY
jgi:hypothetical protein